MVDETRETRYTEIDGELVPYTIKSLDEIYKSWVEKESCERLQNRWGDYNVFHKKSTKKPIIRGINFAIKRCRKKINEEMPTVLDIGCGTGHFMWAIKKDVGNMIGIDSSEEMLKLAKRQFKEYKRSVNFKVGSCFDIPLKNNAVDMSIQVDVCMHVGNSFKSIDEMIRVSKHYIVFTGPSFQNTPDRVENYQIGNISFAVNTKKLCIYLKKMVKEGRIKKFHFLPRPNTNVYKHKILVIEKNPEYDG